MKKVLLYSGGLDSWLIDKLWKPDVKIFIDVKTKSSKRERERLPDDVIVKELDIGEFEQQDNNYYLPLRNLFFVSLASYYGDIICLGATGSSTHYDKSPLFTEHLQTIINYLNSEHSNKKVKIVMPFRNMTKAQMLKEYLDNGGDIEKAWNETYSCYNPKENGEPCMECTSCLKKREAFEVNGFIPRKDKNEK